MVDLILFGLCAVDLSEMSLGCVVDLVQTNDCVVDVPVRRTLWFDMFC